MGLMTRFAAACLLLVTAPAAADPLERWKMPIAEAASRFGLPEAWIRQVIRVESRGETVLGGRPIVSAAGAMGLMQLMPGTWRAMRTLLRLGEDPFDPRDNILAGSAYLRLMYDRFGYPGLFAAYNAGPSRYTADLATARQLPHETRVYVTRVMGSGQTPAAALRRGSPTLFMRDAGARRDLATGPRRDELFAAIGDAGP